MDFKHPDDFSAQALLSQLTEGKWVAAYTILLDLTGSFRAGHADEQASSRPQVLDAVAELHLNGRAPDANRLRNLTSGCDDSPLIVLLQCGNTKSRKSSSIISPFCEPSLDEPLNSFFAFRKGRQSGFPAAYHVDHIEKMEGTRSRSIFLTSQLDISNADCLANAARFALGQHKRWLRSRLKANGRYLAWDESSVVDCDTDANLTKNTHKGASNPKSQNVELVGEALIGPSRLKERAAQHEHSLLEHVLNKCLTGSLLANDPMDLSSGFGAMGLGNENKSAYVQRQQAKARRSKVREFLLHQKPCKGEIYDLTTRAAICGDAYQDVLTFAEAYVGNPNGRVLEAVVEFAFEISQQYFSALFQSAYTGGKLRQSRPWLLLEVGESFLASLVCLADLLKDVEKTNRSACAILDTLYDSRFQYAKNRVYQELFFKAMGPYAESITDWGMGRSVQRDVSSEFFGYHLGSQMTASETLFHPGGQSHVSRSQRPAAIVPKVLEIDEALFVLRAGRSSKLVKQVIRSDRCTRSDENHAPRNQHLTLSQPTVREENVARLEPFSVHSMQVQFSDSSINGKGRADTSIPTVGLRDREDTHCRVEKEDRAMKGKMFVLPSTQSLCQPKSDRPSMFSTLSDSDGEANQNVEHSTASTNSESLPLAISEYAKRLLSPLRFSDDEVQKKVLSFYIEDLRIFEHFGNLRAHILLGAGDFATILVEQIDAASRLSEEDESYIERRTHAALTFYGSAGPGIRSLRDQVHLNRCLRMALNLYSKDAKAHTNCLSLDAVEDEGSRKVSLWGTAVEVQYNVDYPLDLLFSQKVLAMYSKIFNLLLRILRAKRSLRSLFMTSRRNSALRRSPHARFSSDKKVGSALWDFCWQAEHFVSVFGGFQTEQVLGSTWTAFQTSWDTARTIWELKDSHVQYLKDCTHRCLLESRHKSILGVMTEGFDIVINVEKQLSITIEDCTGMGRNSGDVFFDLLKSSSVSLRRRIVFLRDALQRLFDDGPHPHLHDLLTSLGFGKESSPW